ncbi:uncharacterized protein LOC141723950 [Apium graveolens]|uniref:uncharacterized protein LOC141723950 n=1 Tax=Apium graveolens TaxID=4045 RepID=UPI003D7B5A17
METEEGMDWHMNKKKTKGEGEDRISALPDKLIHHILWFCDAQIAVQTSVLSKRWKLIWTTLPFLNFKRFRNSPSFDDEMKFIQHFFFGREHGSDVLKLNLYLHFPVCPKLRTHLIDTCIRYSVSHNVRELIVDVPGFDFVDANKLSASAGLSSDSVKKLVLSLDFVHFSEEELGLYWRLPCLETLHLKRPYYWYPYKLSDPYFYYLPSLKTLLLDGFVLPDSISLPALTTLTMHIVEHPENTSDMFYPLVNLQNLTLFLWTDLVGDCIINCPQLVNLEINSYTTSYQPCNIFVSSRKIQNFSSVSFFPITFEALELKNVNIKFGVSKFPITSMFQRLDCVRILTLTLDLKTIEALCANLDLPSPQFHNLKYLKLSLGHKQSSIFTHLKHYLVDHSPKATIVTALSQNNMIPHTPRNVVLQEPLEDTTQVLVGAKSIHKTVCVDKGVQEEPVLHNYAVNADKARQISAPIEVTSNYRVSSSRGDSDFRLWRGHEVNSEFVCVLDIIMNKYPETFEHFTTINKKLCTMKLNMLCTSVNVFTNICMNQVDAEMISEHRTVFTALQNLGFDVSWLMNRLNFIEQLRFSQPLLPELEAIDSQIENAKNKLQDLQIHIKDLHTLRAEKMQEIQKAFGTMGANLLVGCIGDDLLSGP